MVCHTITSIGSTRGAELIIGITCNVRVQRTSPLSATIHIRPLETTLCFPEIHRIHTDRCLRGRETPGTGRVVGWTLDTGQLGAINHRGGIATGSETTLTSSTITRSQSFVCGACASAEYLPLASQHVVALIVHGHIVITDSEAVRARHLTETGINFSGTNVTLMTVVGKHNPVAEVLCASGTRSGTASFGQVQLLTASTDGGLADCN